MRNTKFVAILPAQLLLTLVITGCHTQEEQNLLDSLEKGVTALEEGDIKDTIESTSKDFLAYPGKVDRGALMWRLKGVFENQGAFSVHYPVPDIEIDSTGRSALVEGPFVISRPGLDVPELQEMLDDPEAWLKAARELTEVHRAEIEMVKSGNDWLVQTIRFF